VPARESAGEALLISDEVRRSKRPDAPVPERRSAALGRRPANAANRPPADGEGEDREDHSADEESLAQLSHGASFSRPATSAYAGNRPLTVRLTERWRPIRTVVHGMAVQ
jgi:hypothetical protein